MKFFGKGWGAPNIERCDVPLGAVCNECGNLFNKEDLGVLMPIYGTDISAYDLGTAAYHRHCLLKILGLESRDRQRLRKAQAVLQNPNATKDELLEALGSIQSTDDPDPIFMTTHDALQARLRG